MNQHEFTEFLDDFGGRFPLSAAWMKQHTRTTRIWFDEVFSSLELADCLAVSKSITKGDIEPWEAYEREKIPAVYRVHAGRMIAERAERAKRQEWKEEERIKSPVPMRDLFRASLKRLGKGLSSPRNRQAKA